MPHQHDSICQVDLLLKTDGRGEEWNYSAIPTLVRMRDQRLGPGVLHIPEMSSYSHLCDKQYLVYPQ